VSAQLPTAVSHCGAGALIGDDSVDLVQAKGSFVEVRSLVDGKLENPLSINCYGRVTALKLFRPQDGGPRSLVFCAMDNSQFSVLAVEETGGGLVERSHASLHDVLGKKTDQPCCSADPKARAIALHAFVGLITIVPLDSRTGAAKDPFSVNVEELEVLDICLLYAGSRLCLALLHEDPKKRTRSVKTYWIDLRSREISDGPFAQPNVCSFFL